MADAAPANRKVAPPGPGNYDLPSFPNDHPGSNVSTAAKFSMGRGRPTPAKRQDGADPGKYHPNVAAVQQRAPGWGFGSARRMLSEPAKTARTPGATIGQIDNPNYFRSPRYGFGTTERSAYPCGGGENPESKRFKRPGPGQHNPNIDATSKMNSVPSYTAAPRRELTVNQKLPGPGSYTIKDSQNHTWSSTPRYKFGTASRAGKEKQNAPGPGQYKVSNITNTGHSSVGDSAPKWSMTGRPAFNIAKDTC